MKKYTLTIPSENYHFSKKSYNPILNNYINKEDFEQMLFNIHKTITSTMIARKKEENTHIPMKIVLLGLISIILTILFIINACVNSEGIVISVILLSLIVTILFGLSFYVYFSPLKQFVTLNDLITIDIRKIIDKVNIKYRSRLIFEYNSIDKNIRINIVDKNYNELEKITEVNHDNEKEGK
jgi:hypothetical protein